MNRLAIIPARGGSKRLPRKNILEVAGRPMLAHTIQSAIESRIFDRIVVSTEDEEVAAIARAASAEVLNRPHQLASDEARVKDVCAHVIETLQSDWQVAYFCVLTATSILRTKEDIQNSFELLEGGFDFVSSVCEYFFYPHAAIVEDTDKRLSYQWPDMARSKGQEVPNFVVENGAINWCRTDSFLLEKELLGKNSTGYRMPKIRSIDVDTYEDYQMIKILYKIFTDNH